MASLEHSQERVAAALLDREAEAQALPLFNDPQAQSRLAIYRSNLNAAWEQALAGAYPVLQALVGAEFFAALARRYGRAHPSQSGDLHRYGEHMAAFLSTFAPVADYPYFPDVARLEWAVHRAYYAPDEALLAAARWGALSPEDFLGARLRLHAACALLASDWAVVEIWQAHQPSATISLPAAVARPSRGLVLRPQWRVEVLSLPPAAHAALSALQAGQTVGAAIDTALSIDADFDVGAQLLQWMQRSVFVGIETS